MTTSAHPRSPRIGRAAGALSVLLLLLSTPPLLAEEKPDAPCTEDAHCSLSMPPCGPRKCQCVAQARGATEPCQEDEDMMFALGCPGQSCPRGTSAVCKKDTGLCEVVFPEEPCSSDLECRAKLPPCPLDNPSCHESSTAVCDLKTGECDVNVAILPQIPTDISVVGETEFSVCETAKDCRLHTPGCGPKACTCMALSTEEVNPVECKPGQPCTCSKCAEDPCDDYVADCVDKVCVKVVADSPISVDTPVSSAACKVDEDCRLHTPGCGPDACTCMVLGTDEINPVECQPGEKCTCMRCNGDPCLGLRAHCAEGMCVAGVRSTDAPTGAPTDRPEDSPLESFKGAADDTKDVGDTASPTVGPTSRPSSEEESGGNASFSAGFVGAAVMLGIMGLGLF